VPASVLEGIFTLTIIMRRNFPKPEPTAALKNFTGGGGVLPAGTLNGYEILSIGIVQVEFALHDALTPLMR